MPVPALRTQIHPVLPFKLVSMLIGASSGVHFVCVPHFSVWALCSFNFFHRVSSVIEECSLLSASQSVIGQSVQGISKQFFRLRPDFLRFCTQRVSLLSTFCLLLGFFIYTLSLSILIISSKMPCALYFALLLTFAACSFISRQVLLAMSRLILYSSGYCSLKGLKSCTLYPLSFFKQPTKPANRFNGYSYRTTSHFTLRRYGLNENVITKTGNG